MAAYSEDLEAIKNELVHLRRLARRVDDFETADEMHKSLNVAFARLEAYERRQDADELAAAA